MGMAKSKNHTNNNQNKKAHRNGIKKSRRPKKMSMKGMECKFLRNQRFARGGQVCSAEEKAARLELQKEAQKKAKEQLKKQEYEAQKKAKMLAEAKKKK